MGCFYFYYKQCNHWMPKIKNIYKFIRKMPWYYITKTHEKMKHAWFSSTPQGSSWSDFHHSLLNIFLQTYGVPCRTPNVHYALSAITLTFGFLSPTFLPLLIPIYLSSIKMLTTVSLIQKVFCNTSPLMASPLSHVTMCMPLL